MRRKRIKNKYIKFKDYYFVTIYSKNICKGWFYIDLDDYDRIKKYRWNISKRDGYISSSINRKLIYLSKFIMNTTKEVDHKNRIRNDNRKYNLEITTRSKNVRNRKIEKRKGYNKSNITGVQIVPYKSRNRFIAQFSIRDLKLSKYCFSLKEAIKQRKKWEKEYL